MDGIADFEIALAAYERLTAECGESLFTCHESNGDKQTAREGAYQVIISFIEKCDVGERPLAISYFLRCTQENPEVSEDKLSHIRYLVAAYPGETCKAIRLVHVGSNNIRNITKILEAVHQGAPSARPAVLQKLLEFDLRESMSLDRAEGLVRSRELAVVGRIYDIFHSAVVPGNPFETTGNFYVLGSVVEAVDSRDKERGFYGISAMLKENFSNKPLSYGKGPDHVLGHIHSAFALNLR